MRRWKQTRLLFFFCSCKIIWAPPRQQEVAPAVGRFPAGADDPGSSLSWICTVWTVAQNRSDLFVFKVIFVVFLNGFHFCQFLEFYLFRSFWTIIRCIFLSSYFRFLDGLWGFMFLFLYGKTNYKTSSVAEIVFHLLNVNLSIFKKKSFLCLLYRFYFYEEMRGKTEEVF